MIRLMTYNLGANNQNQISLAINAIKDENPDILVLNEASWLAEDPSSLQKLSENLELPYFHLAESTNSSNHVALFSRHILMDITTIHGLVNAGIIAVAKTKMGKISIAGIHLAPRTEDTRIVEIGSVISAMEKNQMQIILGDLNSVSPENIVRSRGLSGAQKESTRHEVIEYIKKAGFQDVAVSKHMEQISTVPVTRDNGIEYYNLRLDYIFLSNSLAQRIIDYRVIINKTTRLCSDHFPLVVDLNDSVSL